jgi:hypothetical protein
VLFDPYGVLPELVENGTRRDQEVVDFLSDRRRSADSIPATRDTKDGAVGLARGRGRPR